MHLMVMDENVTDSDVVGEAKIKLSSFCVEGGIDEWYEIQYKGEPAGHIHLKSKWKPKGEALKEKDPAEPTPERPPITFTSGAVAPQPVIAQAQPYYQ